MEIIWLRRFLLVATLVISTSNGETWRPIFKINNNVTDFGNRSNVYDYWGSGHPSYSSYTSDISYIVNSFDERSIDDYNYRSLIIDDWQSLYNSGQMDKIKVSLYKNNNEQAYFIFDVTSDAESWFSQSNLIESSYSDLKNYSSIEYFQLEDNIGERRRRQILSQNINDLSKLVINNNFNQRRLLQTSIGSNYGFIAYYSSTSLNWADSSSYCTGLGYTLAAFHTSTANGNAYSLIYNYVGSHAPTWIGANDISTDGTWEWSDGSDFDYSNWYTGEPNGGTSENCAHFNTDSGTWNDASCTGTLNYFICSTATQLGTDSNGDYYGVKALSSINWQTAEYYCNDLYGMSLASIHSSTQNTNAYNTVYNSVGNQAMWIGLNDVTTDGSWEWTDGSYYDYSNWNSGEPNGATSENCVHFNSDGGSWNDLSCSSTITYFVCNTDLPTSAPTDKPTSNPTDNPTNNPTVQPTPDISLIGSSYGFEGYYSIAGVNWTEANDYCTTLGYNLAAIHSDTGDNTAYSLVYGYVGSAVNVWIGGSDISSEGNWTWSDGSDFDYNNWYPGEPNNYDGNENCGLLYSTTNGSWNDAPCSFVVNYFLCSTAIQIGSDTDSGYYGIESVSAIDWQTAEYYCNDLYGLSLASIHSDADNMNAYDTVVDYVGSFVNIWIGLNDVSSEGNWEWTDGTSYDYSAWNTGEPNGGSNENCVHFVGTYIWNDWYCTNSINYFVCNSDLTNNPTNSPSNEPSTQPSKQPTNMPTDKPSNNPTIIPTNVPSSDPTIIPTNNPSVEPTYHPSVNPTMTPSRMPSSEPTIGGDRYFQIIENFDGCLIDGAWFFITQGTECGDYWIPSEGDTIPQIRYSINNDKYGLLSDDSQNDVADTMVISLNVNDIQTFGITQSPSSVPSSMPSMGAVSTSAPTAVNAVSSSSTTSSVSMSSTNEDNDNQGDNDESTSTSSSSSSDELITFIYKWIIIFGIILIVLCALCFGIILYYNRKHQRKLHNAIMMAQSSNSAPIAQLQQTDDVNRIVSVSGTAEAALVQTYATSPLSQNTMSFGGESQGIGGGGGGGTGDYDGGSGSTHNHNNNNSDIDINMALEMAKMDIPAQPRVNNNNNMQTPMNDDNNNDNDLYSDEHDGAPSVLGLGLHTLGNNIGGDAGDVEGGGQVVSGAPNETGMIMNINGKNLELHKNWEKWNAKDVMYWLTKEIQNAGFEDEICNSFMKQFAQLHMTGKVLQLWLNESNGDTMKLTKKLQSKMSFSPQSVVWDVVIQSIMNL